MAARELSEPGGWDRLAQVVLAMDPDTLRRVERKLSPEDRERVQRVLDQRTEAGWRSTPATMAHHLTGGRYQLWPHTQLLARLFAGAFTGAEEPHQVWNVPSQYGKTTLLGVWGPVWALDYDPTLRLMFVSYDADKAVKEAGDARDLAIQYAHRLRFRLKRDTQAKGLWRTDQGGGLYAVGINGGITGWPADGLLLDDLLKGWEAAHSEAQRNRVWNVWRSQLRLRVQASTSPIIASGTRWHELDYFGQLERAADAEPNEPLLRFHVTRLPAIAEAADPERGIPPDPLGRAPGEVLAPDRFPVEEVRARRATLGSYLFNAMEQQRPTPEEGDDLQRSWWRYYTNLPPRFDDVATSWDMKLKDKEAGDFTVGQVWGRVGSKFWLLDQVRGQWPMAQARVAVALLQVRHPEISRHLIENAGYGPEVMALLREPADGYELSDEMADALGIVDDERGQVEQLLRRGVSGIVPVTPKGPKTVRARAMSGALEAGDFILPEGAPFTAALVDEAAAFPNGVHDDQVDAWSQAGAQMLRRQGTVATAQGSLPKPRVGTAGGRLPRSPIGRRR